MSDPLQRRFVINSGLDMLIFYPCHSVIGHEHRWFFCCAVEKGETVK